MKNTFDSPHLGALDSSAMDDLERLYADRSSCRAFLAHPVPQATIERILRLAQRTASWCNSQPWKIIVTSGAATEKFRATMLGAVDTPLEVPDFPWPREYHGVYLARRRECGFALYSSVGVARNDREGARRQGLENFRFFGAPHVAIVTTDEALGTYGAVDCGAYVASFMAAARAMDVASIAQAALASRPTLVRRHFGLTDDRRLICGISFGYAQRDHPANGFRTSRAELTEAVSFFE